MNRREFLRGAIVSIAAGEALVQLASVAETEALTKGEAVGLIREPLFTQPLFGDGLAYVRQGNDFLPIGYITKIDVRTEPVVDHSVVTGEIIMVPGLSRATMGFQAYFDRRTTR